LTALILFLISSFFLKQTKEVQNKYKLKIKLIYHHFITMKVKKYKILSPWIYPNRRYMSRPGGIWVMTQTYSVIFR